MALRSVVKQPSGQAPKSVMGALATEEVLGNAAQMQTGASSSPVAEAEAATMNCEQGLAVKIPACAGGTAHIGYSTSMQGPWTELFSVSSSTDISVLLSGEMGKSGFGSFVQISMDGANPWQAVFDLRRGGSGPA